MKEEEEKIRILYEGDADIWDFGFYRFEYGNKKRGSDPDEAVDFIIKLGYLDVDDYLVP